MSSDFFLCLNNCCQASCPLSHGTLSPDKLKYQPIYHPVLRLSHGLTPVLILSHLEMLKEMLKGINLETFETVKRRETKEAK